MVDLDQDLARQRLLAMLAAIDQACRTFLTEPEWAQLNELREQAQTEVDHILLTKWGERR